MPAPTVKDVPNIVVREADDPTSRMDYIRICGSVKCTIFMGHTTLAGVSRTFVWVYYMGSCKSGINIPSQAYVHPHVSAYHRSKNWMG